LFDIKINEIIEICPIILFLKPLKILKKARK
jgi:hypothetical protein